jgi:hypothetical protein
LAEQVQQGSKTVRANLRLKTFINKDNDALDKEVNEFLETVDNIKRFVNSRNAYAVGDKLCVEIWYLEAIEEKASPIVQPFGKNVNPTGNNQK